MHETIFSRSSGAGLVVELVWRECFLTAHLDLERLLPAQPGRVPCYLYPD